MAKVILPYPLDLLPELVGRMKALITGWTAQNRRVEIRFDPPDDSLVSGTYTGVISRLLDRITTIGSNGTTESEGPFVVVRLDQPVLARQQTVHSLLVMSRYRGHKPWRLAIGPCVVNLYEVDDDQVLQVRHDAFIGSGLMKVTESG